MLNKVDSPKFIDDDKSNILAERQVILCADNASQNNILINA
jgi:hypothetical protein